jgi:hypothetical protein
MEVLMACKPWRMICGAVLTSLAGGCVFSSEPIMQGNEPVSDPDLAGHYVSPENKKLENWEVSLNGTGYRLLKGTSKKDEMKATAYKYDERFVIAQVDTDGKDSGKYLYWLIYKADDYLLVNNIPCTENIAKELRLEIEADGYSCVVKTKDQLMTLVRRMASQFLDRSNMVPALKIQRK